MNKLLLFFSLLLLQIVTKAISIDDFLLKTVNNGQVNYKLIKENYTNELNSLIHQINEKIEVSGEPRTLKAAYLNLYNLLVIQQVIEHYPIQSPLDVPGFFDLNKFEINNQNITLNELENEIIRPTYNDPRVHFALVCGAKGCPPIQNFSFKNNILEDQLNNVTKKALNDSTFIPFLNNGTAKISEIFSWYSEDFGSTEKNIIAFINAYRTPNKHIKSISYYNYNWELNDYNNLKNSTSNVLTYTPSVLLKKGQYELQFFNNLYTQTAWRNTNGEIEELGQRQSWNTLMMTFNYGISKNNKWNLGLDVNLRSTRNAAPNSNAIEIFKFEQDNFNRTTIATLGPKIKWSPFSKIPKFSIQSSFWIPVAKNLEDQPWLEYDRYSSWTQFFYDKSWNNKYQIFAEVDLWFRIPKLKSNIGLNETRLQTPASVFFSYFPTMKSTIYTQVQYSPTVTNWPEYFLQTGFGGKYQLFKALQIELSYTNFVLGHTAGAGATFNFGLRYIGN